MKIISPSVQLRTNTEQEDTFEEVQEEVKVVNKPLRKSKAKSIPVKTEEVDEDILFDYLNLTNANKIPWVKVNGFPTLDECATSEDLEYIKANTHPATLSLPRTPHGEVDWVSIKDMVANDPILDTLSRTAKRSSVMSMLAEEDFEIEYNPSESTISTPHNGLMSVTHLPNSTEIYPDSPYRWASETVFRVREAMRNWSIAPDVADAWASLLAKLVSLSDAGVLFEENGNSAIIASNLGYIQNAIYEARCVPRSIVNSHASVSKVAITGALNNASASTTITDSAVIMPTGVVKFGDRYVIKASKAPFSGYLTNGTLVMDGYVDTRGSDGLTLEQLRKADVNFANNRMHHSLVPSSAARAAFGGDPHATPNNQYHGNQGTDNPYATKVDTTNPYASDMNIFHNTGQAANTTSDNPYLKKGVNNGYTNTNVEGDPDAQLKAQFGIPGMDMLSPSDRLAIPDIISSIRQGMHPDNNTPLSPNNTWYWNSTMF